MMKAHKLRSLNAHDESVVNQSTYCGSMTAQNDQKRVLALDVRPKRFGFVIFERPNRLLDWGIRSFFAGPARLPAEQKLLALIDDFSPSVIVVRERQGQSDPKLLETLHEEAKKRRITLRFISRQAITKAFSSITGVFAARLFAGESDLMAFKIPPELLTLMGISVGSATVAGAAKSAKDTPGYENAIQKSRTHDHFRFVISDSISENDLKRSPLFYALAIPPS